MRSLCVAVMALWVLSPLGSGEETLTVKVENTCIRSSPSFFVACEDVLSRGDEVTSLLNTPLQP